MNKKRKTVLVGTGLLILLAAQPVQGAEGQSAVQAPAGEETVGRQDQVQEETDLWDLADELLDLQQLEHTAEQLTQETPFSFRKLLRQLLTGTLEWDAREISSELVRLLIGEIRDLRSLIFQLLLIIFAGAVFSNFIHVFENSQIADISFYMIYMLASALLVRAFALMNQMTLQTCEAICDFMQVLLPSYLATVVWSAGTVTALGFYEVTVLALQLVQLLIVKVILPAVHFYLMLLILNQLAEEDYFSRFAQFIETLIEWTIKTVFGAVVGLHAVQCLTAPAVDSLKSSALQRLVTAIPGIGNALDAAAETVAGSAVVLKNAVGVTGILALTVICLTPVVKLAAAMLLFRLLGALVQPICEKRLLEGIDSVAKGILLLLRTQLFCVSMFIISLAMITAAVKH